MPIPYDKRIHFSVCFLITFLLFPLIGWWSIGTAVATGVGKELYDWKDYGLFSWSDIVADVLGVLAGVGIILIFNLLIS